MDKRKFFSLLSLLGVVFTIALIVGYVRMVDTRGDVIANPVRPSAAFQNEFQRVITKKREWPMPDIRFYDPGGLHTNWKDFDGNYLLVNFWATWCAPCVVELPSLDDLREEFDGKGLEVIAISLDQQRSHDEIKRFLDNRGISEFAAHWDGEGHIQRAVRMVGLPTTYLLDPQGNILTIFEGDANWASGESVAFFNDLLDK